MALEDKYRVVTLPSNAHDRAETMGTKEKFWFERDDAYRWLFKFNRPKPHHGDDWSEKIASEVAELLCLPHAEVELAHFEGRRGVVSRDFTSRGRRSLVHGNELLVNLVDPNYPRGQNYKVTEHTVERVRSILDQTWILPPPTLQGIPEIQCAGDAFCGYLILDALIGNTDRHHENWALLMGPTHIELAPTFDHATCLGFNLSDEVRKDYLATGGNRSVESFTAKAKSKLYRAVGDQKSLSPLDAFLEATNGRIDTRRYWIERVQEISIDELHGIVDRVPIELMSETAREFALEIIRINQARISASIP